MADTIIREAAPASRTDLYTGIVVTPMSKEERHARVMALMEEWMTDASGYDEEV